MYSLKFRELLEATPGLSQELDAFAKRLSGFLQVEHNDDGTHADVTADSVTVGSATGGAKGDGTINCAGDVYKNGTAFTNPDYVFEHYFGGALTKYAGNPGAARYQGLRPIEQWRAHLAQQWRFPQISDEPMGAFARADVLLEIVEEQALYICQLHDRLTALEQTQCR